VARFKASTASSRNAQEDVCPVYINQRKFEIFPYVWKSKYFTSSNGLTMDKVGGRDSVDFIANLHEMDGLGIELWWGGEILRTT